MKLRGGQPVRCNSLDNITHKIDSTFLRAKSRAPTCYYYEPFATRPVLILRVTCPTGAQFQFYEPHKKTSVILTLSDPELVEGEPKGKNPRILPLSLS
jgi:hypothetical protein